MKRCPECRRDYYDETLLYCLDDGTALLEGPSAVGESRTEVLPELARFGPDDTLSEPVTRPLINTTAAETGPPAGAPERRGVSTHSAPLMAVGLAVLLLFGGFFAYRNYTNTDTGQIDSIAVLPFQNVSGDPNFEYLSDGIAESLINSLTQLQQLKVTARNTAFRYKGNNVDVEQIGRDLRVRAVLTGRVRQIGERLNI